MQYNNIMVGIMRAFDFFYYSITTTQLLLLTYYYSLTTTHLLLTLYITHYTFFKSITIL